MYFEALKVDIGDLRFVVHQSYIKITKKLLKELMEKISMKVL
jgi:hypothetical protein